MAATLQIKATRHRVATHPWILKITTKSYSKQKQSCITSSDTVEINNGDHGYSYQRLVCIKKPGKKIILIQMLFIWFVYNNQLAHLGFSFWVFSYRTTYGKTFYTKNTIMIRLAVPCLLLTEAVVVCTQGGRTAVSCTLYSVLYYIIYSTVLYYSAFEL